jgi:hypothetical protein
VTDASPVQMVLAVLTGWLDRQRLDFTDADRCRLAIWDESVVVGHAQAITVIP